MRRSTIISCLSFVVALCVTLWSYKVSQSEIKSVVDSRPLDFYVPGIWYGLHKGIITAGVGLIGALVGFARAWLKSLGLSEAILYAAIVSLAVQLLSLLFAPLLIIFFFPVLFFEPGFVVFLLAMAVWALPTMLLGIRSAVQENLSVSVAGPLILVLLTLFSGVSGEMIHTMGRPVILMLGIACMMMLWLGVRHGFSLAAFWSSVYYFAVAFFFWLTRMALPTYFGIGLTRSQMIIDVIAILLLAVGIMSSAYLADLRRN